MIVFSSLKIAFIIRNTFWMFLFIFDLSLEENICTSFCHLCPNILKSIYKELLKKYLHRCIQPFIWIFNIFQIFLILSLKNAIDDASFMYHKSNFHLSTMIFHTIPTLKPDQHYFSVADRPFQCSCHIF